MIAAHRNHVLKMPACNRARDAGFQIEGVVGDYLRAVTDHWLLVAPRSNPAMLEMFRDRDRTPLRELNPWSGEFAGKYLVSAVQVWRLTRDPRLAACLKEFVGQLVACQDVDGYLGPWPGGCRLTGKAPNCAKVSTGVWDAWGHYHLMLGLLLWHEDTRDPRALRCAVRIGDLFCRTFLGRKRPRLVDTGSTSMNLSPVHSLCLLYKRTGTKRYLQLAEQIVGEFSDKAAGDYLCAALAGKEFFEMTKPRWESLHPIMGLAELHWITGREEYRRAFEHIWWSIVKLDRHNNGGFSSGERAQGNPYHPGAIETCCTIAWIALSVEMLRMTGNPVVADELELSTLNSVVGMHSHSGRWVTYNTPMNGVRKASAHEIVFQAREGSPELNCCSVNGPRGFGMISDWALMADGNDLILNWYGPSTMTATLGRGVTVTLQQVTDYPRHGVIRLRVLPSRTHTFGLKLRIPYWSANTKVRVNGRTVRSAVPSRYLRIEREWRKNDRIELELDFSLHIWSGERECAGKASIYRGPILLTYDRRFNEVDPPDIPALDARSLRVRPVSCRTSIPPMLLREVSDGAGRKLRLCDFGSAGESGSPYVSWLKVKHVVPTPFSQANPLRSGR